MYYVNIRAYTPFSSTFGIVLEMELKGLQETRTTPELLPHDLTLQNDGDIETTLSVDTTRHMLSALMISLLCQNF